MSISRKLAQVYTPKDEPGFLGNGHIARPVIQRKFADSDPFILLMDDMLDKKDNEPSGGPHPHAGFETATLIIEGELGVGDESMKTGDFQMMTAGSGIVHTETIDKPMKVRIFQLWLSLPKADRWTTPRVQDIKLAHVPQLSENGVNIKVYSGSLAGLTSPIQNYASMILADIHMETGTATALQLPADYNGFIYVLEGGMDIGADKQPLEQDQVGWLDLHAEDEQSELRLTAGEAGARFVLYAGKPTGDKITPYGPFIGNDIHDIERLYKEYYAGNMQHIHTVPEEQKLEW